MILLDTQTLIWWTEGGAQLAEAHRQMIAAGEPDGIGASVISAWEVGMLVAKGRLTLSQPVHEWLGRALLIPTLHWLAATPQILRDFTTLPEPFHKDPADRIIVATARAHGSMLLTTEAKILAYGHVRSSGPN